MTVINAYELKYGHTGERTALCALGGNPAAIVADYEIRLSQPDPLLAMIGESPATADDLADAMHHDIRRAIESAYFASLSRSAAQSVYHALKLAPQGELTVWADLTYNDLSFANAWEAAHPEDRSLAYENVEYFV